MTKKLSFLFPATLFLATAIVTLVFYFIEKDLAKTRLIEKGQSSFLVEMSQLQNILSTYLPDKNIEGAKLSLSIASLHPNISSVVVLDENAKVMLASQYHLIGGESTTISGFDGAVAANVVTTNQPHFDLLSEGPASVAYYPIVLKRGVSGGRATSGLLYAKYDFSTDLKEAFGEGSQHTFVLFGILLLVTSIYSVFVYFSFTLRVQKILALIRRLLDGKFNERLNWKSEDELGEIARSFDQLAAQRESAEHSIISSLASLNQAQEISHVGSWSLDLITNQIVWSDEVFRIFGFRPQEFSPTYETFLKSVFIEDQQKVIDAVNLSLLKGIAYGIFHRVLRPNGELIYVKEQGRIFYDETGKPIKMVGTVRDVTESHKIETELREYQNNLEKLVDTRTKELFHSSRLAALGEMAGGIAHEINNPLAVIEGKATLALEMVNGGLYNQKRLIDDLTLISETTQRIARIVHGLRVFSRSGETDPMVEIPLSEVISDTLSLCQERFRAKGVDLFLKLNFQDKIFCRPTQLSQVLLNLLNNSYDATSNTPAPWIEIKSEIKNDKVVIKVIDSGQGIPRAVAEKIMQPFFTTKPVGQGTGLGLSISQGIVEDHGGRLWLDRESQNTCFVIELPYRLNEKKKKVL